MDSLVFYTEEGIIVFNPDPDAEWYETGIYFHIFTLNDKGKWEEQEFGRTW